MAVGAFLVSVGLDLSGYVAGNTATAGQSDETVLGIRLVYALLPMMFWLAAMAMLRKYDLNEDKFNAVKAKIQARTRPKVV